MLESAASTCSIQESHCKNTQPGSIFAKSLSCELIERNREGSIFIIQIACADHKTASIFSPF